MLELRGVIYRSLCASGRAQSIQSSATISKKLVERHKQRRSDRISKGDTIQQHTNHEGNEKDIMNDTCHGDNEG